jgi:acyl-coenzyme A synthetase/AMP-(fatty) acid ligase
MGGIELKKSTLDIDIFSAKKRLRKTLPQYTMPKRLFVLPSMPLNINGKVDRLKVKQIINENILKKSSS